MKPDDPQDMIEVLLRSQSSEELPDNGFTAQVLSRLSAPAATPARARRRTPSLRAILLTTAALVGTGIALLGENPLNWDSAPSLDLSHLVNEISLLAGDSSLLLALSILGLSFAALYLLDATPTSEE